MGTSGVGGACALQVEQIFFLEKQKTCQNGTHVTKASDARWVEEVLGDTFGTRLLLWRKHTRRRSISEVNRVLISLKGGDGSF